MALVLDTYYFLLIEVYSVRIIEEPQDQVLHIGDTAIFSCFYNESYSIPYWFVDGVLYAINVLPKRHTYTHQTLIVNPVRASDNGSVYQCTFFEVASREAMLIVNGTGEEGMHVNQTNSAKYLVKSYSQ